MSPPDATPPPGFDVAEAIHRLGVQFEQLRSEFRVVIEGQVTLRRELRQDIADLRTDLSRRISLLEEVVRQNSADIRRNREDMVARGETSPP